MRSFPTFDDVLVAAERLRGQVHRTLVSRSRNLDAELGAALVFKAENLQRMRALECRGAYNAPSVFEVEQHRAGVAAFPSGDHAQGIDPWQELVPRILRGKEPCDES